MSDQKSEELPVVCVHCNFPAISIYEADGKTYKETIYAKGPQTEEEALEQGWVESELGLLCPRCGAIYLHEQETEASEGVESGAGIGNMATKLAQGIAAAAGDKFEGRVEDGDIALPVPHDWAAAKPTVENGDGSASGAIVCRRCGQNTDWTYTPGADNNGFAFATAIPKTCTEMPPQRALATEKK